MNYNDIITVEPGKRGGKPCVRGLRITVYEVLEYLASEMTEAEILEDFPDLTYEDLKACVSYAADRERRSMTASPLHEICLFCYNSLNHYPAIERRQLKNFLSTFCKNVFFAYFCFVSCKAVFGLISLSVGYTWMHCNALTFRF